MEIKVRNAVIKLSDEETNMLKATASSNDAESSEMRRAFAAVIGQAWRAGVLEPDLLGDIFTRIDLPGGVDAKFPLDLYTPDNEGQYVAFVVPKQGKIPDRIVESDELRVPTYKVANAISWSLDYARDARWDIVSRCLEVYTNGFVRKLNDDGWHVILKAASANTQSTVVNTSAAPGAFTKLLILNMRTAIKRQTGGRNSRLTDLYLSPEAMSDILNFDNTTVGGIYLNQLLQTGEDGVQSLFGVKLHEMQEFGVNQEYDNYLDDTLALSFPSVSGGNATEFVVGLDLSHRDQFVMPVRQTMETFDDPTLHRSMKAGIYGWMEAGFAALDVRRSILGAF